MSVRRRPQYDDAEEEELLARFDDDERGVNPPTPQAPKGARPQPPPDEEDADFDDHGGEEDEEEGGSRGGAPSGGRGGEAPSGGLGGSTPPEDLTELRWLEEAATRLLERDPRLTTQWLTIWRIAPPILVLAVLIIIFSFSTSQNPLAYFYIIIAVVSTGGLTIVSFLQYYTLAFLMLAYQLAAAFYAMYQFIAQMNDVLTCNSVHCNHGKKWIYTTNWVLQGFSVGAFLVACRAITSLLSVHREIRRGIYAGPTRTILDPEPVSQYDDYQPEDYLSEAK